MNTRPAGSPVSSSTEKKESGEPEDRRSFGEVRKDRPSPAVSIENTLNGLRSESTNTMTNMSLRLATMSVRFPRRTIIMVAIVGLSLIAVGGIAGFGVMLVYSQNTATIATTTTPPPTALPVEIGVSVVGTEGDSSEGYVSGGPVVADLGSGKVSGSSKSSTSRPGSQGKAPAGDGSSSKAGGSKSTEGPIEGDDRRSSSTTVEAPSEGTGGGSTSSSTSPASSEGGGEGSEGGTSGGSGEVPTGGDLPERDLESYMYAGHVRRVIRQFYAARAQSCFDRATRNNHNLRGTVVIRFTVGSDGNVSRSSVSRNSTGDDDLGLCLAGQVRSWRLPVPPDDQPIDLEMPFSW